MVPAALGRWPVATGWASPVRAVGGAAGCWGRCPVPAWAGTALAERPGCRPGADGDRSRRAASKSRKTWRWAGQIARRANARRWWSKERKDIEEQPAPVVIEPVPVVRCPKRARGEEKQKPCSPSLPTASPPQGRPARRRQARQENRPPRRWRMTSRLIEKKAQGLRRRGARGGPYARPGDHALRDRAGHGVKGSQVVNLAKDLARSAVAWCPSAWSRPFPARTTWRWNCPTRGASRSGCPRSWARVYNDAKSC